ncbi:TetR/AcrR family transcriptional regulator [Nocardia sp. NPDC059240]|uniref:TetR/AcrR family transcriptional regulator n=1 Tax=Nocardia sp. NPDC059240 TaxID=3346786 RepID=UPI0036A47C95
MTERKSVATRSRMTPERLGELYDAVLRLLAEVGYEALTLDAVAARAKTSKATLYRQWNGKTELVAAALRHAGPPPGTDSDTGTLRGDLIALAARSTDGPQDASVFQAINNAARREPVLHQVLSEIVFEPTMRAFEAAIERAVARAELGPDVPAIEFVVHMVMGGTMTQATIESRFPDRDFVIRYIDAVVLPALRVR